MSCSSRGPLALQGAMSDLELLTPTPVQAAAIPALLSGKNAAIQSYTGSGKVRGCPFEAALCLQDCLAPENRWCHGRQHNHMQTWQTQGQSLCPRCPGGVQQPRGARRALVSGADMACLMPLHPSAWHADVALLFPTQTLAYLLPTLSRAIQYAEAEFEALQKEGQAYKAGALQALIVAPSRELAMQIIRVAQELLPPAAKNTVQQCIGGANPHRQVGLSWLDAVSCWDTALTSGRRLADTMLCSALALLLAAAGCTWLCAKSMLVLLGLACCRGLVSAALQIGRAHAVGSPVKALGCRLRH